MEHGKATLKSYAGSHWQQRSNMAPSFESYQCEKRKKSFPRREATSEPSAAVSPKADLLSVKSAVSPYRITSKRAMVDKHSSSRSSKD